MTPKIIRTEDRVGRAIVRVQLSNRPDVFVTLDRDQFDGWVSAGLPTNWYLNRNGSGTARICFCDHEHRGRNAGVARRLLELPPHTVVRYADGDPLNLRRCNLQRKSGWAKGSTPRTAEAPGDDADSREWVARADCQTAALKECSNIEIAVGGSVERFQASTDALLLASEQARQGALYG